MAEKETIALSVEIGGTERAINSLKDLKTARKDLQNEMLQGNTNAAKSLAQLEDKFEDLKDATKSVKGDGIEPLRNSFGMFKDGIMNFDMGKIGTAFKGLGAAMKAVPIFLLVEGITYLVTNFKELSEGTGILATALKPIGELIGWITDGLYMLTDAIGLTNSALDKMGEDTVKNAEASKEAISQQNAEYDRQIKVAKAAGESTVEIEKAKQQSIIETNKKLVEQTIEWVRQGGVLDEEKKKLLTGQLEAIKNAKVEEKVIDLTHQTELNKVYKEKAEEKRKLDAVHFEAKLTEDDLEYAKQSEILAAIEADKDAHIETDLEKTEAHNAELLNLSLWRYETEKAQRDKEDAEKEEMSNKNKERKKEELDRNFSYTKQSLQATQEITGLYFQWQLNQAKGNSKRELEIKKKQFQVEKAFKVALIVMDTVKGMITAISNNPPPNPIGIISAALIGVAGTLATVKTLSTKFDEGGGGSGGGVGDVGGSISGGSAPAIASPNNTVTKIDDSGQIEKAKAEQPMIKAVVVETDITDKQKRINTIQEGATI